jgi:hypothetical protein
MSIEKYRFKHILMKLLREQMSSGGAIPKQGMARDTLYNIARLFKTQDVVPHQKSRPPAVRLCQIADFASLPPN